MIRIRKRNPTNEGLLKKLKIKKEYFPETNEIFYIILLNNNEIGSAVYRTNKNVVDSVGIDKEYRRKGVATWLYNYIEKDRDIKLTPSKTLMRDGELFWMNRLKRKNPTNYELLKEIKIQKLKITEDNYSSWGDPDQILYRIIGDNRILGQARYDPRKKVVDDITIYECKRQGLATYLYDYIEADQKIILKPSEDLLDAGKAFWKARLNK